MLETTGRNGFDLLIAAVSFLTAIYRRSPFLILFTF